MWKVVCAILGYILGGFLGGLLGFIVGGVVDRTQIGGVFGSVGGRANVRLQQETFFRTLFLLMGRLAKSDGQVSEAEIQLAQSVMQRLRLSPVAQEQARQLFNEGKSANFDLITVLNNFRDVVGPGDLTRTLLEVLLVSAYADGHFSVEEIWRGAKPIRDFALWDMAFLTDNAMLNISYEGTSKALDLSHLKEGLEGEAVSSQNLWRKVKTLIKVSK